VEDVATADTEYEREMKSLTEGLGIRG
jgi:hypothetical protein